MTAKKKPENQVKFIGGHHDSETMVIDSEQDKIVLDWAGLVDLQPICVVPDYLMLEPQLMPAHSSIGKDTYYRNPTDVTEFLFDDGKDPRLARYLMEEELVDLAADMKKELDFLAGEIRERELRIETLEEIVGDGFNGVSMADSVVRLTNALKATSHYHPIMLKGTNLVFDAVTRRVFKASP